MTKSPLQNIIECVVIHIWEEYIIFKAHMYSNTKNY